LRGFGVDFGEGYVVVEGGEEDDMGAMFFTLLEDIFIYRSDKHC